MQVKPQPAIEATDPALAKGRARGRPGFNVARGGPVVRAP